jgi:putative holliday junction resolvase
MHIYIYILSISFLVSSPHRATVTMKFIRNHLNFYGFVKELPNRGRLMAIDHGTRKTGIYYSNKKLTRTTNIFSVLFMRDEVGDVKTVDVLADSLHHMTHQHSVIGLVFGLPGGYPPRNAQACLIERFVEDVKKTNRVVDMPYTYFDEDYSSVDAEVWLDYLKEMNVKLSHMMTKDSMSSKVFLWVSRRMIPLMHLLNISTFL